MNDNIKNTDLITLKIVNMISKQKFVKAVQGLVVENSNFEIKTSISNTHVITINITPKDNKNE